MFFFLFSFAVCFFVVYYLLCFSFSSFIRLCRLFSFVACSLLLCLLTIIMYTPEELEGNMLLLLIYALFMYLMSGQSFLIM